ncbi:unnamed protein product [Protopolystoma xenopodis]|uniref:Uncharacterized protein n=1 Tax=Protopolystoma xenopodis TaxID=117903 RepID=A0A3S5C9E0_9PLAT|nr:unnamed protein product [Protopolystoma xenopodis]
MIGYDIERLSWGYLVDRAKHLGRTSICRDISRLSAGNRYSLVCHAL